MSIYQIHNPEMTPGFIEAWRAAAEHLQSEIDGKINWLSPSPYDIKGSHLTFGLGNQIFFVFVEIDDRPFETMEAMFLKCAAKANAVACIMPMRKAGTGFESVSEGAGLVDAHTRVPIDPVSRVTSEPIEMSDWEVHDFGIQIVAAQLKKEGKDIKNTQSHVDIDPSIWFEDRGSAGCVVVRVVRYPTKDAPRPPSLQDMADTVHRRDMTCFFASVGIASSEQSKPEIAERVLPLMRGRMMTANFEGLEEVRG
jgi:hypothetical protein